MSALVAALIAIVTVVPGAGGVAVAAGADYPAGFEAYHTYAEMEAAIDAAVATQPTLVHKFSIGQSYEGREIWAVKISDQAAVDEHEPEVMFECGIHAREHLTTEMCLYVLRLLTEGYGLDPRITDAVDRTELYLIPLLNPDGAEFDIASGAFASWRKNRQPVPGSTEVGVDLNRNYGFNWRCCKGGSDNPARETYRGWAPWVAPEVAAHRPPGRRRSRGGRRPRVRPRPPSRGRSRAPGCRCLPCSSAN